MGTVTYSSVIVIPGAPPQSSASGTVFIDPNQNGWFDSGETPLAGTTVYLTDSADTYVIGTATTDASGSYAFAGLGEGSYRVKHPVPSGFFRTTDDSVAFSVAPDFGHNFGIAQLPPTTVELYATDYTPPLNSGYVQVWAEFSPPVGPEVATNWEGCTPDQMYNTVCWVETTTPGNRTVNMSAYVSGAWVTDSLVIAVQQAAPQLRIFLDADNNFNPASPVSDRPAYVPGSDLATGVSVPLPQTTTLIAAFVNPSNPNQIVAPPAGVTSASFSLNDTSAFMGIAMNSGTNPGPDFTLAAPTADFDLLGDWTARVGLLAHDYGGFTRVSATAGAFTDTINSIPRDPSGNMIPDGGWIAWDGTPVADGNASEDVDGSPPVGDGLIRFEEYRGFMVGAEHRRTRPDIHDLFVFSNVPLATNGVGHATNLPVTLHRVLLNQLSNQRIVNFTLNSMTLPGHLDQHAVLVFDGGLNFIEGDERAAFGWIWCEGGPCVPSTVGAALTIDILQPQRNVMILTGVIGLSSNQGSDTYGGDPADAYIVNTAIAHEIGHAIHIEHYTYVAPRLTVMVDALSNSAPWFTSWFNLPSQYDGQDTAQIRFKP